MVFYDPQHSLSLIHYCSNYLRAFSPVSSLDHPEYMPGLGFILGMAINVLRRPSSRTKYHDNYSTVPNLYIYVRSVPCFNTIY